MSKDISYHVGYAHRDKDGKPTYAAINTDLSFYTRSAAEKALHLLLADYARRKVEPPKDEFSIVRKEEGSPDRYFDYWRTPSHGLPAEDERVLLYCESRPHAIDALLDQSAQWLIVIGKWNGDRWVEDRSSKSPAFPVKFWMSLPDPP